MVTLPFAFVCTDIDASRGAFALATLASIAVAFPIEKSSWVVAEPPSTLIVLMKFVTVVTVAFVPHEPLHDWLKLPTLQQKAHLACSSPRQLLQLQPNGPLGAEDPLSEY